VIDRRKDLKERGGCEIHRHVSRSLHSPMRLFKMKIEIAIRQRI
jgi:hypothetical protein